MNSHLKLYSLFYPFFSSFIFDGNAYNKWRTTLYTYIKRSNFSLFVFLDRQSLNHNSLPSVLPICSAKCVSLRFLPLPRRLKALNEKINHVQEREKKTTWNKLMVRLARYKSVTTYKTLAHYTHVSETCTKPLNCEPAKFYILLSGVSYGRSGLNTLFLARVNNKISISIYYTYLLSRFETLFFCAFHIFQEYIIICSCNDLPPSQRETQNRQTHLANGNFVHAHYSLVTDVSKMSCLVWESAWKIYLEEIIYQNFVEIVGYFQTNGSDEREDGGKNGKIPWIVLHSFSFNFFFHSKLSSSELLT